MAHTTVVAHSKAPFAPVVPQGQSSLPDGPTAVRADSLVTVSFDTPMTRTRIPAKFERLVRSTLTAVYGQSIDSVLSKIPEGGIARQGDLVSELPTRGVRIPRQRRLDDRAFSRDASGARRTTRRSVSRVRRRQEASSVPALASGKVVGVRLLSS